MYTEKHQAIIKHTKLNSSVISVSGYKHAATVIISASIINPDLEISLHNVPNINDIKYMSAIIENLGGKVEIVNNILKLNTNNMAVYRVPELLSEHIHGAVYFLPTILGRFGYVELGNCGGCKIGETSLIGHRPIAHMLSVLEKFGGKFYKKNEKIFGESAGFHSCTIDIMDYSSSTEILTGPLVSGATKTAILAAACVKLGKTRITNPYPKPDVTELLFFLETLGYKIEYFENAIEISKDVLQSGMYNYSLMSDISQIMTYICLAVYHEISLTITNVTVEKVKQGLKPEIEYLEKMGIILIYEKNAIKINKFLGIKAVDIDVTSIGIYSDHQPFFALMLLNANGKSTIREHVWKKRFSYAIEFMKLGFELKLQDGQLEIYPSSPSVNKREELIALDLRAAAVLLIAALAVPGETCVIGINHLTRGYDNFIDTLKTMGASITIDDVKSNQE